LYYTNHLTNDNTKKMNQTQTKRGGRGAAKKPKEPKEVFVQTSMRLPEKFMGEVDDYRWAKRKPSFTKALIELAQIGLQHTNHNQVH